MEMGKVKTIIYYDSFPFRRNLETKYICIIFRQDYRFHSVYGLGIVHTWRVLIIFIILFPIKFLNILVEFKLLQVYKLIGLVVL